MIPAGYVDSIIAWATRPDLTDDERSARRTQLLELHDALATGQLTTKALSTLTSGSANGKNFAFAPQITLAEKLPLLTTVLLRLGLLDKRALRGGVTYGKFTGITH